MFKDKTGRILYIGKAVNLRKRVRSHFSSRNNSPQPPLNLREGGFIDKVTDIDWIETDNESQAYLLENELIKKYKPRYNIQWRDDKSYYWILFSADEWPRVRVVHQTSLRPRSSGGSNPEDNGNNTRLLRCSAPRNDNLIGPFVNGRELRQLLRALRKALPYRTCKNPYDKPCLQWHLGLCPAHDPHCHSRESRNPENKKSGSRIKCGMTEKKIPKKQKNAYLNSLNVLSQFLRLYAGEPIRIEAYDISNIHGVWATGSMIVFDGAKPKKSDYRKFKIKTVTGANDVAMIKEVLKRRFGHPEWPYPDLILIDGGIAQLHAAHLSLVTCHLSLPIVALAKREEEIYTEYSHRTLKLNALPVEMRLIFQAIRNEAHRFAIFYYRHLHRRNMSFRP